MIIFWLAIVVLTLGAIALVVLPLVRQRGDELLTAERQQRMVVYKDRRREIERERDSGRLDPEDARLAIDALAAEAATTMNDPATAALPASARQAARWPMALFVALLVPAVAIAVYRTLGAPMLADPSAIAAAAHADDQPQGEPTPEQIAQALADLRERTRTEPDNPEAWAMLAQALRMTNDLPGALDAYGKAVAAAPRDARLLAELAETQAAASRGDFRGKPLQLLEQAIALAPDDPKVLALMGAARYRLGEPEQALVHLRKLRALLPPGSEQVAHIDGVIQRIAAEAAGGKSGPGPMANAGPRAGAAAPQSPAGSSPAKGGATTGATISGRITVTDAQLRNIDPKATLFIYARAAEGPRIPYAIIRATASQLPMDFTLSDDQAMDPQRLLSSAGPVIIEARVSRSGNAIRQSGDLTGASAPVRPGARNLVVTIDQTVP